MYTIKKTVNRKLDLFDKEWDKANVAEVTCVNWKEFPDAPYTTAKILYNDYGIWVQMQTDEKEILARCTTQNGDVSCDSCMEFFFRPNENDPYYLNFEFNAFGTMYFGKRTDRYNFTNPEANNWVGSITIKSTALERRIKAGTTIEITITQDESRTIHVSGYTPARASLNFILCSVDATSNTS